MGYFKQLVVVSQFMILYHLLGVSAEESSSHAITVTHPELQVLQETLNIISREIVSMKTKYEENQALIFSSIKELQSGVSQSNVRANEFKQQFDEHKLDVADKLEDIKEVMIQDHAMLETNTLNVFNNMVDVMVDIKLHHRLQGDILNGVQSVSGKLQSLKTNSLCEEQETNCLECSDNRRLNKTIIFPDDINNSVPTTVPNNNVPSDIEILAPLPPAPDSVVLHETIPAHPFDPPAAITTPTPPPPPPETTSKTEPTTKKPECEAPFFSLKATGECMVVSVTKRTWMDAQNSCLRIGAYLAVPEDPRVLHSYMRQAGGGSYYYVGAHNKLGNFHWLNGTLVDGRYWRPHSPSSSYAGRLCVAYTQSGSGNKLLWANKATLCDTGLRYNFICEK